ncbi:MAG: hypothetical protein ACXWZF_05495 [Actinomycetota bacterium]
MNDHREHQAGTRSDCRQCAKVAYEPGWYATLLGFAQVREAVRLERVRPVTS